MTYALRCLLFGAFYAGVGSLAAGRWSWLGGWLFSILLAGGMGAQFVLLARFNPALLAERTSVGANTKGWDRLLMPLTVVVAPLLSLVVAGLDARLSWTRAYPLAVQLAGLVSGVGAYSLTLHAMVSNRFFSGVVRIQTERGQQVERTGPYRWVRHPGYLGMIGFFVCIPFVLGSRASLLPTALGVALHLLRTWLEDRTLLAELPGYREYAGDVRYRLVPLLW
jgi:protein-S-isoprenylcysteine O-methyltransferase Ste14